MICSACDAYLCAMSHTNGFHTYSVQLQCDDSNVSTFQIASKPITPCEKFHKNACIKLVSYAEQITPCERTFSSGGSRISERGANPRGGSKLSFGIIFAENYMKM